MNIQNSPCHWGSIAFMRQRRAFAFCTFLSKLWCPECRSGCTSKCALLWCLHILKNAWAKDLTKRHLLCNYETRCATLPHICSLQVFQLYNAEWLLPHLLKSRYAQQTQPEIYFDETHSLQWHNTITWKKKKSTENQKPNEPLWQPHSTWQASLRSYSERSYTCSKCNVRAFCICRSGRKIVDVYTGENIRVFN